MSWSFLYIDSVALQVVNGITDELVEVIIIQKAPRHVPAGGPLLFLLKGGL